MTDSQLLTTKSLETIPENEPLTPMYSFLRTISRKSRALPRTHKLPINIPFPLDLKNRVKLKPTQLTSQK